MKFNDIVNVFEHLFTLKQFSVPINWKPDFANAVLYLGKLNAPPTSIASWEEIVRYQIFQTSLYTFLDWDKIVAEDYQNLDVFIEFLKKTSNNADVMNSSWSLIFWAKVIMTEKKNEVLPYVAEFLQTPEMQCNVQNFYYVPVVQQFFSIIMVAEAEFYITQNRTEVYFYTLFVWLYKLRKHYPGARADVVKKLAEVKKQADFSVQKVRDIYDLFAVV